jgi:RNA polymerase sigma-70 factor, ECF subfamily
MDPTPSDLELIAAAKEGKAPAFAQLVRRHSRLVFRIALRVTGNASDAEEVMQDVFLQVHRKLEAFRGEAKFSTWLYSIVINAALMHLRARRGRALEQLLDEGVPEFDETGRHRRIDVDLSTAARADELVEHRQLARAALEFVGSLPELYRLPFVLRDLEGMESEEVAALLGIEVAALRQRLHRARLILRERLNQLIGAKP